VVNGQKVWTSNAHIADWMFALVRTSRGDSDRHEGISCLILDLHEPGVNAAPIKQMTGEIGFSQVFLDNVKVPADHLVGEEGGGWAIARTTLGFERATAFLAQQIRYLDIYDQLIEMARPVATAARRDDIVRGWIEVRILRLNAVRTLLDSLRRGSPGPESAINRLLLSRFEQRVHELAVDVLGMGGLVMPGSEFSVQWGRWAHGLLRPRASTIGSGTSEMQMLALAEKVLGLPSDPSPAHG
jgi:alkylation response protein AidB-like acyl-CoA dehydrogenase